MEAGTKNRKSAEEQAAAKAEEVKAKVSQNREARPRVIAGEKVPVRKLELGMKVAFSTKRGKLKACEVTEVSSEVAGRDNTEPVDHDSVILKTKTRRGPRLVVGLKTKTGNAWDHYATPREQIALLVEEEPEEETEEGPVQVPDSDAAAA